MSSMIERIIANVSISSSKKVYFLLSFYFVGFGVLVAFLTSVINYQMQVENMDEALHSRFENVKETKFQILSETIAASDAMLVSIASNAATKRYLTTPNPAHEQALQDLLMAIIVSRPNYMQVRILDLEGFEKLRIDRLASGVLSVISKRNYQDKSDRYYFKESLRLKENQFWASKLDLNEENGVIEQPIRPTIRVSTPLYLSREIAAIAIVNIDVSQILSTLSSSSDFSIYIQDGEGEILHHPNPNIAWTRYLDNREPFRPSKEHVASYSAPMNSIIDNGEQLRLVMLPMESMLSRISKKNVLTASIIAGIVVIISFPLSWLIALFPARLQQKLTSTFEQLQRSNKLLDKHVISSNTDTNGKITLVSERMCEVSGYKRSELIGQNHNIVRNPKISKQVYNELWSTIQSGETWQGELHNVSKSGQAYCLRSMITPEYDESGQLIGYAQIAQEITAVKALEHLSVTDALTQLYNRHKMDRVLAQEEGRFLRYQHVFSIILIDLDYFKHINDSWGHQVGDDTLIAVAKTLSQQTRELDYIGRWGGEEFIVICPSIDLQGATELAEKLRKSVVALKFKHYRVTASMGVACYDQQSSINQLISNADKALYQAKSEGRNCVVAADTPP